MEENRKARRLEMIDEIASKTGSKKKTGKKPKGKASKKMKLKKMMKHNRKVSKGHSGQLM